MLVSLIFDKDGYPAWSSWTMWFIDADPFLLPIAEPLLVISFTLLGVSLIYPLTTGYINAAYNSYFAFEMAFFFYSSLFILLSCNSSIGYKSSFLKHNLTRYIANKINATHNDVSIYAMLMLDCLICSEPVF